MTQQQQQMMLTHVSDLKQSLTELECSLNDGKPFNWVLFKQIVCGIASVLSWACKMIPPLT
jgi:hypothetical protein